MTEKEYEKYEILWEDLILQNKHIPAPVNIEKVETYTRWMQSRIRKPLYDWIHWSMLKKFFGPRYSMLDLNRNEKITVGLQLKQWINSSRQRSGQGFTGVSSPKPLPKVKWI